MIGIIVSFIFQNYTMYPSSEEMALIHNAVSTLFPSLTANGIVSISQFYDNFQNTIPNLQDDLTEPLKNALIHRRRKNRYSNLPPVNPPSDDISVEEQQEIINFFKTTVLPANKNLLIPKLMETVEFRRHMIANSFEEYKTFWNFYFVCPDLVI